MCARSFSKLSIALLLSLFSCSFTPDEEYLNNIQAPEPIEFSIEVNDPNFSDPYYLLGTTQFTFTLNDLTKPLVGYEVVIDGNTSLASEEGVNLGKTVAFTIFPHAYSDGMHTISLRLKIATQSGSLAEKIGAEYHFSESTFKLVLDRRIPQISAPPVAAYENGYLTVRWPSVNQQNFKYTIRRVDEIYTDTSFYKPGQTVFVDKEYIGGNVTYKVMASGYGFEQQELGNVYFSTPPFDLAIEQNENRVVRLSWDNVKINTTNVSLSLDYGFGPTFPLTASGTETIDTLALGEDRSYWVDAKRGTSDRHRYRTLHSVRSLKNLREYESFAMLPDHSKLIVCTGNGIYRYSLPDFAVEDSLMASEFGFQKLSSMVVNSLETKAVIVGDDTHVADFDPLNFDTGRTSYGIFVATRQITGNSDEIKNIWLGNLSDNDLLTIQVIQHHRVAMLFNLADGQVSWHAALSEFPVYKQPPVISRDGNYLTYDVHNLGIGFVYEKVSNEYAKIGEVEKGWKFFKPDTHELITVTSFDTDFASPILDGKITVYSLTNVPADPNTHFQPNRSKIVPAIRGEEYLKEIGYDPITHTLYSRYMENAMSYLRLLDTENFNEVGNKLAAFTYTVHTHSFSNQYQVSSRGFIEKVE